MVYNLQRKIQYLFYFHCLAKSK